MAHIIIVKVSIWRRWIIHKIYFNSLAVNLSDKKILATPKNLLSQNLRLIKKFYVSANPVLGYIMQTLLLNIPRTQIMISFFILCDITKISKTLLWTRVKMI